MTSPAATVAAALGLPDAMLRDLRDDAPWSRRGLASLPSLLCWPDSGCATPTGPQTNL